MKIRNLFAWLSGAAFFVLALAGTLYAYDVSGTIHYAGTKTGRVYIVVTNRVTYGGNGGKIGVFYQNNSGTLNSGISSSSYDCPEPVEIADLNNDGRKDIIVAHGGWMNLGVYLQGADGTLSTEELYPIPYASHYNPHGLAVGDINGDGFNDVVIADYNNGLVVLYHK